MPIKHDWPARDADDVKERALKFKEHDPFPKIPTALLSSAEIEAYARVTAMLDPFDLKSLKSASYEAHIGGRFILWDENGKRIEKLVGRNEIITLPANSISFIQVEPEVRLPDYIAIRFNLRITHVHRGILLGTGPLVDPGFQGKLLIPLHNLTASPYSINTRDALIWIEFTKTTFTFKSGADYPHYEGTFCKFPEEKMWLTPDDYLSKASGTEPIRSSIPELIRKAETSASTAAISADKTAKIARNVSISGAIVVVIALASLIIGGYQVVTNTLDLISGTSENLARIESNQTEIADDITQLRSTLKATLDANGERDDTVQALRNRLDALAASVDRMEIDIQGDQQ